MTSRKDAILFSGKSLVAFVTGQPTRKAITAPYPDLPWKPERKPRQKKEVSLPRFSWEHKRE